jgi:hypothetical protein
MKAKHHSMEACVWQEETSGLSTSFDVYHGRYFCFSAGEQGTKARVDMYSRRDCGFDTNET